MNEAVHDVSVSVSGAGPAGLSAALTIARSGLRATVFERRGEVGARFHNDFQGLENWTSEGDVLDELASIGIEPTFEAAPFRSGVFFDPAGREYRYQSSSPLFYLVRRGLDPGTLDSSLKEQATAAGVEIRFNDSRSSLPEGGIVAQGPRAADAVAVGYVFETDMADGAFGILNDRFAPKGYSYLLIHRGRGTVAACLFKDFHSEREYLERTVAFFQATAGLRMKNEARFGGVGNFSCPPVASRGRMLFVGEAAGFQDALWGFGMRYAVLSGHLAARALIEGKSYNRLWRSRLGGLVRTSIVNRYFFERLGELGYSAFMRRIASVEDAREWLRRHYAPLLWKRLWAPVARRAVQTRRRVEQCVVEGCDCTWCRCQHEGISA